MSKPSLFVPISGQLMVLEPESAISKMVSQLTASGTLNMEKIHTPVSANMENARLSLPQMVDVLMTSVELLNNTPILEDTCSNSRLLQSTLRAKTTRLSMEVPELMVLNSTTTLATSAYLV